MMLHDSGVKRSRDARVDAVDLVSGSLPLTGKTAGLDLPNAATVGGVSVGRIVGSLHVFRGEKDLLEFANPGGCVGTFPGLEELLVDYFLQLLTLARIPPADPLGPHPTLARELLAQLLSCGLLLALASHLVEPSSLRRGRASRLRVQLPMLGESLSCGDRVGTTSPPDDVVQ